MQGSVWACLHAAFTPSEVWVYSGVQRTIDRIRGYSGLM
jgi:hypothetical protein